MQGSPVANNYAVTRQRRKLGEARPFGLHNLWMKSNAACAVCHSGSYVTLLMSNPRGLAQPTPFIAWMGIGMTLGKTIQIPLKIVAMCCLRS
jgi:hypothetical protein